MLENQFCRQDCSKCHGSCPHGVPVSRIMRYSYYYELQGYEKHAMQKYAELETANGSACENCNAPCTGACPHELDVQQQLLKAHSLLTLG